MYVNPIQAYQNYWKKTFKYNDYASRSEFWWPKLVNTLIFLCCCLLTAICTFITIKASLLVIWVLWLLFKIACIFPNISVGWRRLRDANIPGYMWFIHLIGVAGHIAFLILTCLRTKNINENVYRQQDAMRRRFAERNRYYVQQ